MDRLIVPGNNTDVTIRIVEVYFGNQILCICGRLKQAHRSFPSIMVIRILAKFFLLKKGNRELGAALQSSSGVSWLAEDVYMQVFILHKYAQTCGKAYRAHILKGNCC